MAFEYHWHRKEANFGSVIETEIKGGTHFTVESILMFEGKFVALRRPNAIPHHEIPQRVGKSLLYFVHDLPIWGESLKAYVDRIVQEQAGVKVKSHQVIDFTMKTYEEDQQWALTLFVVVDLESLPIVGVYGNEVTEVIEFTVDDIPDGFGWYETEELKALLTKAITG